MQELSESDESKIKALLLGRRIVAAETGEFKMPEPTYSWGPGPSGRLTLDDGTTIYVEPNQGGCACGAGDYTLAHLASVDNIITDVRIVDESHGDDSEPYDTDKVGRYQIFVVADAVEVNVLTVEGDDGNGYYGTGYRLFVHAAANSA